MEPFLCAVVLLTATAVPATGAPPGSPHSARQGATVVQTDHGLLRGVSHGSYTTFDGVPYAAPPTGPLRWRAPVPAATWSGVRDATTAAQRCVQMPTPGGSAVLASEDCLYLNVTMPTPPTPVGHGRPVLVWMHGGAFLGGAGESAGALSICAHLTSPTAVGLFQRAVLSSGSCLMSFPRGALGPGTPAYEPFAAQREVQTAGAQAARQLGCAAGGGDEVLACLRGRGTDQLATAQLMQSFNRPAFGNALLPVAPDRALASGRFHRVPVIQGTNHDEMRMFVGLSLTAFPIRTENDYRARLVDAFGSAAPAVEAQYPAAEHPTPALAWAAVLTDRSLTCTTLAADRGIAAHAPGLPLYGYEFSDPDAPVLAGLPANQGFPYGAAHGFEMPYLFSSFPTERPLTDAQRALSDRMVDYWTNFAHTGNPNTPDAPHWPAQRSSSPLAQPVQSLAPGPGGIHPVDVGAAHHCSFWDRLPQ
ncbi:carboxylesterase family protein [Streptomyces sp. H39-S7]|uniref:carboxylesterase family protein n=1 Tax=Streptomyces sp. H39-S7 TaxID=3004357 RepID=UPI0022B05419|nr:carboxylesterase family protein [Streptomyces sp. H39-S7]MCZ4124945.1 carboxylesterase family protein [Streptomyces sp. H39-S7]